MKHKHSLSWKYIVYMIVFMATALITFISMHYQAESAVTLDMTEAELPLVMVERSDGTVYNAMHGITMQLSDPGMDTPLTPLARDKKLNIAIDTYGSLVESISYKIRDTRDNSLIENTELGTFETSQSRLHATLNIKDLLSDDVEYMLEISVSTQQNKDIKYYTRIVAGQDAYFDNCLDFALEFNRNTYDASGSSAISQYIETTYGADNSNYGSVDIYCSTDSVTWGDIDPFIESNVMATIESIDAEIMILSLDYTIGAMDDATGDYDTYSVHEYYRVRQGTMGMFLLSFKRQTDQIFDGNGDLFPSGKINLGIQSQLTAQAKDSNNHEYTSFVSQGSLWTYSKTANEFIRVFSFDSDDSDNVRERYLRHKVKIMDITDSGDITFIIYGYMNRGAHEGKMGVSLYQYSYGYNTVEEKLYIPLDMPYERIEENVGDIAYVNSENSFFITINDTLYAIELNSKEVMTEVVGLTAGTYKTSEDGRIIAYSLNGELNNTDSIRIFNLEQGSEKIIEAPQGQVMKVLGFIEEDCIYGYANIDDITYEDYGSITYPIHTLDIMDNSYEIIKEYHEDGIYLSGVSIDGYRINLTRVIKDGSGGYSATDIDQLINRSENSVDERVSVDSVYTTSRHTEVVLVLPNGVGDVNTTTARAADNVQFQVDRELVIDNYGPSKELYYVFGAGKLSGTYEDINSAVIAANNNYGYVKDADNQLVWKKYKTSTAAIKGLTAQDSYYGGTFEGASGVVKSFIGSQDELKQVTLKGVSYEVPLTFVSRGKPVIAATGSGYVIIVAYDSTQVTYLDSGREVTVTNSDASKLFSQGGNVYVTYYK